MNNTPASFDLSKVDIKDNDILLLRNFALNEAEHLAKAFSQHFENHKREGVMMIFLSPDQSIENVSERQMEKAGWVRKPVSS